MPHITAAYALLGLLALACGGLLAGCGSTPRAAAHPAPPAFGTAMNGRVPAALLALPLVDAHGQHTSLGAMRGKVLVLNDMMTLCQETCAIGTASMLQAARAIDRTPLGNRVEFLSITIDPTRDDRRHLAAYQRQFGSLPNWRALTGSPADINRLWDRLGVWRHRTNVPRQYPRDWLTHAPLRTDISHTDDLIFVDGRQRFRFLIDGPGAVGSAAAIPARIYRFMDRLGHQNVHRPSTGSWSAGQVTQVLHWMLPTARPGATSPADASGAAATGVDVFPVAQREPVPELSGTTLTGRRFSLAGVIGHGVVAVNVWASWCGPCRQEMPLLARAAGHGLRVVGIDERDQAGAAQAFAQSRGAAYPSLQDPAGQLLRRLSMLPQAGIPSTVFVDARGRVAARVVGPVDEAGLRHVLRRIGGAS
ncbi:MAG: redoxin domain-containing protein [Nocardioidaceae bacterium]